MVWVMKKDQVVAREATNNPSSLLNLHSLTTTNMEKQRKIINYEGRVKEIIPELNL
jgi:hypothetical protein